jgi:hypothetical protein
LAGYHFRIFGTSNARIKVPSHDRIESTHESRRSSRMCFTVAAKVWKWVGGGVL